MLLTVTFFVLYAAHTEATCPDVRVADNFNMTAFATGIWNDLARYPNHFETAEECLSLKYSLNGDVFRMDSINVPEDQHNFVDAFGKLQPDNKILLTASTGYPRQTVEISLTVMFVDHDKYAVIYDCIHDENNETKESVWIVGRDTTLEGADKEEVYKFIKSSNLIDINKLVWINYSDEICNQQ